MKEVLPDIERWRARGEKFALATVVATRRSAPRPVGAKFAVSESGEMAGSVSGGCVESDVYEHACEVLDGSQPQLLSYGISDDLAFSVGLPCGGEIDVFVERAPEPLVARLLPIIESEERAVLFTVVEGEPLGADLLVTEVGETFGQGPGELAARVDELLRKGRNTLLDLDEGRKVFAEIYGPAPKLLVIGAVDTAEALCAVAKQLGWRTIVADARGKFATKERIPSADELLVAWPQDAIAQVQPDYQTAVVVLTHDDKFDVPAIQGALATEAFYIGALGSRRNQERRRERLLEAGVEEQQFERVSGPTGLDIGADTPSETALSILGEILATRAGRDGGFLRNSKTRIHVEESDRAKADAFARESERRFARDVRGRSPRTPTGCASGSPALPSGLYGMLGRAEDGSSHAATRPTSRVPGLRSAQARGPSTSAGQELQRSARAWPVRVPAKRSTLLRAKAPAFAGKGAEMAVDVKSEKLHELVDQHAQVEKLATGFTFTEGPLWNKQGRFLLFSDMPGDVRRRWSEEDGVTEIANPSNKGNGMTYDAQGRLLVCEHSTSSLVRMDPDGVGTNRETLASHYDGKELNSPNDVIVADDGSIYFSDPWYGRMPVFGVERERELGYQGVYRIAPEGGDPQLLVDDFEQPNGLCFSPDESLLYINDTPRAHIRVFDRQSDGTIANGRMFFDSIGSGVIEEGIPDGMKIDERGNIYVTGPGGAWVISPDAELLGVIEVPENVGNLNWGGDGWNDLYMPSSTSLYRISMKVSGNRLGYMT